MPNPSLLTVFAKALLAGPQNSASLIQRIESVTGKRWRGLPALVSRYKAAFAGKTRPGQREVLRFLSSDPRLQLALRKHFAAASVQQWLTGPQEMQPAPAAAAWKIPAITSIGELAEWLRLTQQELDWFADLKHLNTRTHIHKLDHYSYTLASKRSAGFRLIEAPKQHLKLLQRQILKDILNPIPAHPTANGFVQSRSILTFASPHADKRVVLRMDIENFFPSISAARVNAFFRTAGYPEPVAERLAALCTHSVPNAFWKASSQLGPQERFTFKSLYGKPHLPQGAPTSPALANLCAYRLDSRLQGLAQAADATYTRYADDLAFSGDQSFARHAESFSHRVGAILLEEGFRVHHRKTRIMREGVRQQLAGLVVNRHPNIARDSFDQLKAILTNCLRHGPMSQNREGLSDFRAHLSGRIGFVESISPKRGAKLRKIFAVIAW